MCSLVVEDDGGVTKDFEVVIETDGLEVESLEVVAWLDLALECLEVVAVVLSVSVSVSVRGQYVV